MVRHDTLCLFLNKVSLYVMIVHYHRCRLINNLCHVFHQWHRMVYKEVSGVYWIIVCYYRKSNCLSTVQCFAFDIGSLFVCIYNYRLPLVIVYVTFSILHVLLWEINSSKELNWIEMLVFVMTDLLTEFFPRIFRCLETLVAYLYIKSQVRCNVM